MPEGHERRRLLVCDAAELEPGGRVVRRVDGLSVGVFNVKGRYYALHNRCPHSGGALCEGPVTGTAASTSDFRYAYERDGEILRCAWHGWEFDIATGQALADPGVRARTYAVSVEEGQLVVSL